MAHDKRVNQRLPNPIRRVGQRVHDGRDRPLRLIEFARGVGAAVQGIGIAALRVGGFLRPHRELVPNGCERLFLIGRAGDAFGRAIIGGRDPFLRVGGFVRIPDLFRDLRLAFQPAQFKDFAGGPFHFVIVFFRGRRQSVADRLRFRLAGGGDLGHGFAAGGVGGGQLLRGGDLDVVGVLGFFQAGAVFLILLVQIRNGLFIGGDSFRVCVIQGTVAIDDGAEFFLFLAVFFVAKTKRSNAARVAAAGIRGRAIRQRLGRATHQSGQAIATHRGRHRGRWRRLRTGTLN